MHNLLAEDSVVESIASSFSKMKPLAMSVLVLILAISICIGNVMSDNITFMVALNSTSFDCPIDATECYNVTINELITCNKSEHKVYVFQSGTHSLSKNLSLNFASNQLAMKGQVNARVNCDHEGLRIQITAPNVSISSLQFLNHCNIEVLNSDRTYVEITNCTLSNSSLRIKATRGKQYCALTTVMDNVYLVNSNLTLDKSNNLTVMGYGTSDVAISCTNSRFYINIAPEKAVTLHDVYIQDCQTITLHSQTKSVIVNISKSRLNNSCLKFQPNLTRSGSHTASVAISKTTIEQCFCGSVLLFSEPKIHVNVSFHEVNVTDNYSPILKSPVADLQMDVFIFGCNFFHRNKNFIFYVERSALHFTESDVYFIDNTVNGTVVQGTPIYAKNSNIIFKDSTVLFSHNQGQLCGGIAAESTRIYFYDDVKVNFSTNGGLKGGALSLYSRSRLIFLALQSNITIVFENNTAQIGGAIYVEDSDYRIKSIFDLQCEASHVKLVFGVHNIASFSGDQIYGGWIDWLTNDNVSENHRDMVNEFVTFESENNTEVTCNPIRICLCVNNSPNCTTVSQPMEIHGHAFSLDLVGVGQRSTPVLSHIEASLSREEGSHSGIHPRTFSLQSDCTTVNYKIIMPYRSEEMITVKPYLPYLYYNTHTHYIAKEHILSTDGNVDCLFQDLSIKLKINECPWGFCLNENSTCECHPSIQGLCLHCNMDNYTIHRSKQQWIGAAYEHNHGKEDPGVIAHQHCPFDYCRSDDDSLSIRLENRDKQCAFDRVGILCGGCKENLSRVLGTSNCKECTNKYTLLIFFSWLISGFILVACLMLFNLTVSVGTINGLTFYANIIRAQHTTFFTPKISNSFLSKFIAWLNLDIGTEMCFYDGLDSYAITWLQFFYPLYIWLIAAILIILSRFSSRISKFCGKNAVQVLATLFLISYARLLRLMIKVFSFTTITYPDGYKKTLWLIDGNYEFFKRKHIPLVLVTVLFVLLSLPYTFILLTIQFLYKIPHYHVLFWVRRLKPLFDAYTGPYKSPHRYWTGLLLVARIVLLITFSVNHSNNLSINLLAIVTVSILLLGWLSSANWVYESPLNNFLEILFLANLGLISAAVSFNIFNGNYSPAAIYLSTSIAFVVFIFIILYHVHRRLVLTKLGSKLTVKVLRAIPLKRASKANETDDTVEFSDMIPSVSSHTDVSSTMVDLDQSFKPMCNSYNLHELKEPLLDDD